MTKHFDSYEALFNCHINNAQKRTEKVMKKHFSDWLKEIKSIEKKNGLMAIMQTSPTPATACYIGLITYLVNHK